MNRSKTRTPIVTFRVKVPLRAVAKDTVTDTVIPPGSVVEWEPGDFAGGVASVFWQERPVAVMESDLFMLCERLTTIRAR